MRRRMQRSLAHAQVDLKCRHSNAEDSPSSAAAVRTERSFRMLPIRVSHPGLRVAHQPRDCGLRIASLLVLLHYIVVEPVARLL